jgi:signal peptidase II
VDYIDFQFWPVFNIADAAVVVGGLLLVLVSLREPEAADAEADDATPPAEAGGGSPADSPVGRTGQEG